jgi:hypothetical protein
MMNRDDIIRMALKAGISVATSDSWIPIIGPAAIERFFTLAYEAGAAAERERIIAANAPEIERINAHIKELEQARLEEREACARACDAVAESANKAAVAGQYLVVRNGAEARRCSAAIRAQAADRLARHGISIPEDEEYGNPSF